VGAVAAVCPYEARLITASAQAGSSVIAVLRNMKPSLGERLFTGINRYGERSNWVLLNSDAFLFREVVGLWHPPVRDRMLKIKKTRREEESNWD
jgi:hypothetical protein